MYPRSQGNRKRPMLESLNRRNSIDSNQGDNDNDNDNHSNDE